MGRARSERLVYTLGLLLMLCCVIALPGRGESALGNEGEDAET